jgi:AcrR family transcriptional regulator
MSMHENSGHAGQRGPSDHSIRDQIVEAADEHFSHYGYGKTTVADLAKAIGFSKAYIYKFFDSKQAIGEAICARCLGSITASVEQAVSEGKSAHDKLRRLLSAIAASSVSLFFNDRKLYDIAIYSCEERWPSSEAYAAQIETMLIDIIKQGREAGEFERKTPIDEAARAIMRAFQPFMNPLMLQYNLDGVPEGASEVISLILRSLAP